MAIANRGFGSNVSTLTLAGHSVIEFFKSIDLDINTSYAVAYSPHDARLSTDGVSAGHDGWEYPRPTERDINLSLTLMVPKESSLSATIVQDSGFDTALSAFDSSIAFDFIVTDDIAVTALEFSGTAVASQGSLDFPGDEATTMIQLESRTFAFAYT